LVGSGLEFMLGKGGPMELVMRRYNYFEVWGRGVLEGLEALRGGLGVFWGLFSVEGSGEAGRRPLLMAWD
jgi:hypothetical protein